MLRFHLASMEFHYQKAQKKPLEKIIEPLLEYLQNSAHVEPQCRWEAEFLLGQFLWQKNRLEKAREYLLLAYQNAPDPKLELQETYQLENFD